MSNDVQQMFPHEKFADAKRLLTTVKPWWSRYLNRFEAVPILVPADEEKSEWRANVSVVEHSLTMYVDVNFAMRASLPQLAGAIEHELQRSRRRFDERAAVLSEKIKPEFWRIATRMEVASALDDEYRFSTLAHNDLLNQLLSESSNFGPSRVDKYDIDSLPVADETWMPQMFDMEENLTAEDYAYELARRDGAFDENADEQHDAESSDDEDEDVDDSATTQEQTDKLGDADSGESAGGESESDGDNTEEESDSNQAGSSNESDEKSDDNDSESSDDDSGSENGSQSDSDDDSDDVGDSADFGEESDDDSDGESGDRDSESESSGGESNESNELDSQSSGSSDQSPESGQDSQDSSSSSSDEESEGYQQLNTDTDDGLGRSGGWQGKGDDSSNDDASQNAAITNDDDVATSTGIEESNQQASSDARTDRQSSGTTGNFAESEQQSAVSQKIEQMKQEYPSLEWDAEDSRPEIFDPYYSEEPDETEVAERQLESNERQEAEEELIEDVKDASLAQSLDPSAPMMPSMDDVEIADKELQRRGIHWTDYMAEVVSAAVNSVVLRGSDDYSYAQRNPNQGLVGPILMGGITYSPKIYAVFDTSGSMLHYLQAEQEFLADFFETVQETYFAETTWFAANSNIYSVGESVSFDNSVAYAFALSGGGTNFATDIAAIMEGDFEFDGEDYDAPDLIVLFSDMEFRWNGSGVPEDRPDIPVISVMPAKSNVPKVKKRVQKTFAVPDWIYDPEFLVEMI